MYNVVQNTTRYNALYTDFYVFILSGGQTGIRTLETVSRLHTFQACAFDHSATCPLGVVYETGARFSRA